MPQGKTENAKRKLVNIRKKFKLGGRGQNKSAHEMSTADLLERLESSTASGKDKGKIRQVLAARKVAV